MDAAAAAEPTDYTTHLLTTLGERVSTLEGTIRNYDRIFDMLHEGQRNLRIDIGKDIANTNQRIEDLREDIDKRFGEMNERITGLETRIDMANIKMDSTFKWILGVQIAMWVTIIAAVLL